MMHILGEEAFVRGTGDPSDEMYASVDSNIPFPELNGEGGTEQRDAALLMRLYGLLVLAAR